MVISCPFCASTSARNQCPRLANMQDDIADRTAIEATKPLRSVISLSMAPALGIYRSSRNPNSNIPVSVFCNACRNSNGVARQNRRHGRGRLYLFTDLASLQPKSRASIGVGSNSTRNRPTHSLDGPVIITRLVKVEKDLREPWMVHRLR